MGFSYTSVSPTLAHKHSNTTGDGGTLDQTSLYKNGALIATVHALG